MEIFSLGSLDEELPRARLALLLERFSELSDDREPQRIMYPLHEVLLLVTCATIASCDDFDDIVLWGEHHLDFSAALQRVSLRRSLRALGSRPLQPRGAGDEKHRRKRPRPHRNARLRGLRRRRLDHVGSKLTGAPRFSNIKTILKLSARVEHADRCSFETRYFISSAPCDIERLAAAARGHWGVESMHWLLEVEFKDNLSRYRAGHGAKNMATLRRFALGLVRANKSKKQRQIQTKSRRLEPPIPPRNPSTQMIVNLDSEPWRLSRLFTPRAAPARSGRRNVADSAPRCLRAASRRRHRWC